MAEEKWYAVCDKATGLELKSVGTVLPDKIADHLEVVELESKPDFAVHEWDGEQRKMVDKKPVVKPFQIHMLFDRITPGELAFILVGLGLSAERAAELTADG